MVRFEPKPLVPRVAKGVDQKPDQSRARRQLGADDAAGLGKGKVLAVEEDRLEDLNW